MILLSCFSIRKIVRILNSQVILFLGDDFMTNEKSNIPEHKPVEFFKNKHIVRISDEEWSAIYPQ